MDDGSRPFSTAALIGTGVMGRGIAQLTAQAGLRTLLYDTRPGAAEAARDGITQVLQQLAAKGRLSSEDAAATASRLIVVTALDDLVSADLIIEAIVERLDVKQALFRELEARVAPTCVLTTNTSSLSVTAIAAALERPDRMAGFHFFNPAPLMKIVEVVAGARTSDATCEALCTLTRAFGHRPVRVKDWPGFLINHAGRAYVTEAMRVLSEGVASAADLDRIMREAAGFRMGPCELLDLTGLDVSHPVMESIYHQFYEEPRFRPSPETQRRLEAGLLGRKSGEGFYRYQDGRAVLAPETPVPNDRPASVWISRADVASGEALAAFVRALPGAIVIEDAAVPSPAALCLVTPFGTDATTAALAQRLDPVRTVAVDMLFGLDGRITLMHTPLTSTAMRRAAQGLIGSGGHAVTMVADSPGAVAQRVAAMIVNVGCDIAQQRIAAPEDIDLAVERGLGYPRGPLALGDALTPARVLQVLEALHWQTGDPRYRPSLWLRRRAALGVSLTTPDRAD